MNYKELLTRAVVTFVQGAVAYLAVAQDTSDYKALIAGAVGAGLSLVYNTYLQKKSGN